MSVETVTNNPISSEELEKKELLFPTPKVVVPTLLTEQLYSTYGAFALDILDMTGIVDSEEAHGMMIDMMSFAQRHPSAMWMLQKLFTYHGAAYRHPYLMTQFAGMTLGVPGIVEAGQDKNWRCPRSFRVLGAGAVIIGSVLEDPQEGRPKKRQWIVGKGVPVNWIGLASDGSRSIFGRGRKERAMYPSEQFPQLNVPTLVNFSLNEHTALSDIPDSLARMAVGCRDIADAIIISFGCPNNTVDMRPILQTEGIYRDSVDAVKGALAERGVNLPIILKGDPDSAPAVYKIMVRVAIDKGLGLNLVNTTADMKVKKEYPQWHPDWVGGLSGQDPEFIKMAQQTVAFAYLESEGNLDIIATGGIESASDVVNMALAGGKAFGSNSGIRNRGLSMFDTEHRGIVRFLKQHGLTNLSQIRGTQARTILNGSRFVGHFK